MWSHCSSYMGFGSVSACDPATISQSNTSPKGYSGPAVKAALNSLSQGKSLLQDSRV